jgi:1-acyl-sn-glycerol-3-phosphate acyltransferase
MRAIRYVLGLTLFTVWYGGKVIVAALFGLRRKHGGLFDDSQQRWARALLRWHGIAVVVVDGERINRAAPAVYISNHASFIDIWALLATLPGSIRFVAKKEFFRLPIIGLAMKAMGHVFIDRANRSSAFSSYDAAAEAIRSGTSVVVFAEGTRSRTGKLLPFKKGPFVLAVAAEVPIIPVCCAHTFDLLPKGSWSPKRGTVEVRIGEPIPTKGLSYEARDELASSSRAQVLSLGAKE